VVPAAAEGLVIAAIGFVVVVLADDSGALDQILRGSEERIGPPEVVADDIERVSQVEVVTAVGHATPPAVTLSIGAPSYATLSLGVTASDAAVARIAPSSSLSSWKIASTWSASALTMWTRGIVVEVAGETSRRHRVHEQVVEDHFGDRDASLHAPIISICAPVVV
jgi:hypothetical protein